MANIRSLTKKAKIVIVCLGIIMCVCVMLFLLYNPIWLYSFGAAFLSYIILMIISFWSIKTKVNQKIIQASQHNTLATQKESSKCVLGDPETSNHIDTNTFYKQHSGQPSISRKQEQKKILKFLDISKLSLGFELSFSLPRIIAFLGMILIFSVLVWLQLFYPIAYLMGVCVGALYVVLYLLFAI